MTRRGRTGPRNNAIYQVGGKSFIFFRTPRPDAIDPMTGEGYPDVIVFWVASEAHKHALIRDESTRFSPRRASTGIRRCYSAPPPVVGELRGLSWPNLSRTPGSHERRLAAVRPGSAPMGCDGRTLTRRAVRPHPIPVLRLLQHDRCRPAGEPQECWCPRYRVS
jgi:hypothetical protein